MQESATQKRIMLSVVSVFVDKFEEKTYGLKINYSLIQRGRALLAFFIPKIPDNPNKPIL